MATEVFIERRYELRGSSEVIVRFQRPTPSDVDFQCEYEIVWPDRVRAFRSVGIDEVQALILALKMVHVELLTSPEGKRDELRWLGSKNLGLPNPVDFSSTVPL